MSKTICLFAAALAASAIALGASGNRQLTQNELSPPASTSARLGAVNVTIEYNAPSARGRKIEGGLIPYNQWYRLGADAATTITTDGPIMIGNLAVPKGAHTLYLFAKPDGWQLIVNKQTGQWGLDYDQKQDLGRIPMQLTKSPNFVEKFNISLKSTGKTGVLDVSWGNTKAEVPISGQ